MSRVHVILCVRELLGNILDEFAVKVNVEHLNAAADAEDGQVIFYAVRDEVDFCGVALRPGVNSIALSFSIKIRMNVFAAGEDDALNGECFEVVFKAC